MKCSQIRTKFRLIIFIGININEAVEKMAQKVFLVEPKPLTISRLVCLRRYICLSDFIRACPCYLERYVRKIRALTGLFFRNCVHKRDLLPVF